MKALTKNERAYWEDYLATLPKEQRPNQAYVSANYAGSAQITDSLFELYLTGKKVAGSSLAEDFLTAHDPLPQVGNYWIYLDGRGNPCGILKTEKVVTHKFKDVPLAIALAEGEGDLSLEYWKKVHIELYSPFLETWGVTDINEATVITEYFTLVYKRAYP